MQFYELILGTLTVWRLTHLLNSESGPWDILARFRVKLQSSFWGKLMDCFYCLSLWMSAPIAIWLGGNWTHRALLWLSLSAAAILLERVTNKAAPALYYEDPEAPKNAL